MFKSYTAEIEWAWGNQPSVEKLVDLHKDDKYHSRKKETEELLKEHCVRFEV